MNTVRKAAAWFLCFSMLLSNTTVYAEDILSTPGNNHFTLQGKVFQKQRGRYLQQEEDRRKTCLPEENCQSEDNLQDETEENLYL